jgi:hypothetical protein
LDWNGDELPEIDEELDVIRLNERMSTGRDEALYLTFPPGDPHDFLDPLYKSSFTLENGSFETVDEVFREREEVTYDSLRAAYSARIFSKLDFVSRFCRLDPMVGDFTYRGIRLADIFKDLYVRSQSEVPALDTG